MKSEVCKKRRPPTIKVHKQGHSPKYIEIEGSINADDSITRIENLDLACGDIENITFRNIYAENCFTAIRMLSVKHAIRNIRFEHIYAGCRTYAINMDAARYCASPLFREDDYPSGVGNVENVHIHDMKIYSTNPQRTDPLICIETLADDFTIENFERLMEKDRNPRLPTVRIRNVCGVKFDYTTEGLEQQILLKDKGSYTIDGPVASLSINRKERASEKA